MKKILGFALLLATTTGFADELHNFKEIKAAVTTGKSIHIVTNFSKCITSDKTAQPSVIGVFTPEALMVKSEQIATSLFHFTLNNPKFSGKPVYEFVRYTIDDDNVVLTGQPLSATDYAPLADAFTITCQIDVGAKVYT